MSLDWNRLKDEVSPGIIEAMARMGFPQMTPVQANTIPLLTKYKDVVVEAVTGSGKTLAFAIPVLEKCLKARPSQGENDRDVVALIISPTRELAKQIHLVISDLSSILNEKRLGESLPPPQLLTGGNVKLMDDLNKAKEGKPKILIGTPGRLAEFIPAAIGSTVVKFSNLEILIVDEADRMLEASTLPALRGIISYLPKQRRTGLFSATMTDVLVQGRGTLGVFGLRNPVRIVVKVTSKYEASNVQEIPRNEQRIPPTLTIQYIPCFPGTKLLQLYRLLMKEVMHSEGARKVMVFVSTCAGVDYLYRLLHADNPFFARWRVFSLHGQMQPSRRNATFKSFNDLQTSTEALLLTTDVSARGLDMPDVDFVIQYDAPTDPSDFTHRCGRTARAGRKGRAIVLLNEGNEEGFVDLMQVRKVPIQSLDFVKETDLGQNSVLLQDNVKESADLMGDEGEDPWHSAFVRTLRAIVSKDRYLHDLGLRAFVSFVRSYSKHEASYIFRLKDLLPDLGLIARGFGLLQLPAMPEIRHAKKRTSENDGQTPLKDLIAASFARDLDADFNWKTFAYADPRKEAARQQQMSKKGRSHKPDAPIEDDIEDEPKDPKLKKSRKKARESWSVQSDRQAKRLKRQEQKTKKHNWQARNVLEAMK